MINYIVCSVKEPMSCTFHGKNSLWTHSVPSKLASKATSKLLVLLKLTLVFIQEGNSTFHSFQYWWNQWSWTLNYYLLRSQISVTSRYIYLGRENLLDRSTFAACLSAFNTQELAFNACMYIVKTEIHRPKFGKKHLPVCHSSPDIDWFAVASTTGLR